MRVKDLIDKDSILENLCDMVIFRQKKDSEYFGLVGAAIVDKNGKIVRTTSYKSKVGKWIHAEKAALEKYETLYGPVPEDATVITTLSPCNDYISDRFGESCTSLIDNYGIRNVYYGYSDHTQHGDNGKFHGIETNNHKIRMKCKLLADMVFKRIEDQHEVM